VLKRVARALIPNLPHWRWRMESGYFRARKSVELLGAGTVLRFAWDGLRPGRRGQLRAVRLPGFRFPLYYRVGTSDPDVIRQVFLRRDYECAIDLARVENIVDCGANVGYSAFYLLHLFPTARVVVAEPDAGNMALCRRNLAPFGTQVTFVQAGVWSSHGPLVIERGRYGDGNEWSFQVRPAQAGEPADVNAVTVGDLMAAGGFSRIDLLKMDIEAAEGEVFRSGTKAWLGRVRNLVIELHGPDCEGVVRQAMASLNPDIRRSGELTFFRELAPCS
jgi:FkbM family methyltransferase